MLPLLNEEEMKKALSILSQKFDLTELNSSAKEILDDLEYEFLEQVAVCSLETELCRRIIVFPDDTSDKPEGTSEYEFQLLQLGRNISDLLAVVSKRNPEVLKLDSEFNWFYYKRNQMILIFYAKDEQWIAKEIENALDYESKRITEVHSQNTVKSKKNNKSKNYTSKTRASSR